MGRGRRRRRRLLLLSRSAEDEKEGGREMMMMTLRERERLDFVIGFHPPTPCHLQRRTHNVQRRKIRGADLCTWGYYYKQVWRAADQT